MILWSKKLFTYLLLLVPFFLITGPALPDIAITLSLIFGVYYLIFKKEYKEIINISFFKISIIFWLSLIFIRYFLYNKSNSFQDSIIFIRFY